METDYMAETINDSLKGLESVLRPQIYQMQQDKDAELSDVAEQGKIMLYGISNASDEILELAKDSVVKYAREKDQEKKPVQK